MIKRSAAAIIVISMIGASSPVQAEEQLMNLWPNQRAKHLSASEDAAAKYKARGQAYVDHMYATGGEEPIAPDTEFVVDSASDVDPVRLNIKQVSDIVKDEALKTADKNASPPASQ